MKSLKKLFPRLAALAPFTMPVADGKQGAVRPAAPVDVAYINNTIERALSSAGLDARSGTSAQTRETIQTALRQAGLGDTRTPSGFAESPQPDAPIGPTVVVPPGSSADVDVSLDVPPDPPIPAAARGTSVERSFGNAAGTRAYTLYVPAGHDPRTHDALPLVVMLHGCTQSPADFAAGTRMNALADRHGVLVAYPSQTARDNGSRCWNWFRREDQVRDGGEPSILAGIVGHIAADHRVDPRRVYVAGLSAGAGMAVILGRTYPDVFAAVGAHSGLPFAAAHDVPSAFSAMQGAGGPGHAIKTARRGPRAGAASGRVMPTIVFHGNADRTVHQRNGAAIVQDAVADSATDAPLSAARTRATPTDGRAYTRETFTDASGRTMVEQWLIDGAGHAWSGGDPAGTYTDPQGPDASAQMLRFFLQHAR